MSPVESVFACFKPVLRGLLPPMILWHNVSVVCLLVFAKSAARVEVLFVVDTLWAQETLY